MKNSKSGAKMNHIPLSEILEFAAQNKSFDDSISGNAQTLIIHLRKETKSLDNLSERDQATWNGLEKKYNEFKLAVEDSPAETFGEGVVNEAFDQADQDVQDGADLMNELTDPAPGAILFHKARNVFGEVVLVDDQLMVQYYDGDRRMKMAYSDKWTAVSDEAAQEYRDVLNEAIAAAPQPIGDPNDMMDVSVKPENNTAIAVIDKAIDGEIVLDNLDILDSYGTDEDLSGMAPMTDQDVIDLEQLETIIENELPNWEKSNDILGTAFLEINNRKLFRGTTGRSFVKYIFEKFKVTRAKAYQLMITAEVKAAITNNGNDPVEALPSQRAAQTLNQITKEVKGLLADNHSGNEIENYDRMLHKFVWEVTLQSAPRDADQKPMITPGHLQSVKDVLSRIVKEGIVSVDGEDIPIGGLHSFVDNAITEETVERTGRMKEAISDKVRRSKEKRSESQERVSVNSTGQRLTNTVQMICSEHGEAFPKKFIFGGMVLSCGCAFLKVVGKDELQQTDTVE